MSTLQNQDQISAHRDGEKDNAPNRVALPKPSQPSPVCDLRGTVRSSRAKVGGCRVGARKGKRIWEVLNEDKTSRVLLCPSALVRCRICKQGRSASGLEAGAARAGRSATSKPRFGVNQAKCGRGRRGFKDGKMRT
uniref:Uncharacterized protein n=1 Tax=Mycena chlorophos TaxID=658473 RepID=A0ABQ0L106_MYCCL|nr:predicted protein [Mycena chlorophos]